MLQLDKVLEFWALESQYLVMHYEAETLNVPEDEAHKTHPPLHFIRCRNLEMTPN